MIYLKGILAGIAFDIAAFTPCAPTIGVHDDLAFQPAWEFEAFEKHIAGIVNALAVTVARVLFTVSRVIPTRVIHRALPPVARDRRAFQVRTSQGSQQLL